MKTGSVDELTLDSQLANHAVVWSVALNRYVQATHIQYTNTLNCAYAGMAVVGADCPIGHSR